MNTSNHYFSLLSFKGQKLENRFRDYKSAVDAHSDSDLFFDDLICYFDNPDLISVNEFYNYDINTLLPYLKLCHEDYLENQIPVILRTLEEAIKLNEENSSFESHAPKVFSKFFEELQYHITLEEEHLYPYAFKLENNLDIENLDYSTKAFAADHKAHQLRIDDLVAFVDLFKNDFVSNFAFARLQKQLQDFKQDIGLHELLEDKVLLPKLVDLEAKLGL